MTTSDLFVEHGEAGAPLDDVFVMDAHCHLGPYSGFPIVDSSVESLLRAMDLTGVNVAAVCSMVAVSGLAVSRGNDEVIDAVQRHGDRIQGYMIVNPRYPKAAGDEMKRCLAAGLCGIKVHAAMGTPYDHPSYEQVWAFAAEHRLVVLAHAGGETCDLLTPVFERFPAVTWIMAHGGISKPESYVRVARDHANVYFDTSFSQCPRGMLEYFVGEGVEDKILFASDAVFLSTASQLGKILFARITPGQKKKILGENARKAFRR